MKRRSDVFQQVAGLNPGRSTFDLSYSRLGTYDMGLLYPVMCEEAIPGDVWTIAHEAVARMMPMVAPMMHETNLVIHTFFVPNRLLWADWEDFITGGTDGDNASVLPRWTPTDTTVGSLWDVFGFPTGVVPTGALPLAFGLRAYNLVYNEYYRDQTLIDPVDLDDATIKRRAWTKDYFTSALPWQQRGTAPSLPIIGTTEAVFNIASALLVRDSGVPTTFLQTSGVAGATTELKRASGVGFPATSYNVQVLAADLQAALNDHNTVDLSAASSFRAADLRNLMQLQKWMERNARSGARYTESLQSHFGVSPRDERLQRPEYIGGIKAPLVISEVLQQSETGTTPQGTMAGHGLCAARQLDGKYHVEEHGWVISIMSIMPKPAYQQGIDRQWLRTTRYDYYWREFANLSEQPIQRAEIYATAVEADNKVVFGYQGRYDEYRTKRNMVTGMLRESPYYTWHLGRIFAAAPELNKTFIECNPSKRELAVTTGPTMIINVGNLVMCSRLLPEQSDPGLLDHF